MSGAGRRVWGGTQGHSGCAYWAGRCGAGGVSKFWKMRKASACLTCRAVWVLWVVVVLHSGGGENCWQNALGAAGGRTLTCLGRCSSAKQATDGAGSLMTTSCTCLMKSLATGRGGRRLQRHPGVPSCMGHLRGGCVGCLRVRPVDGCGCPGAVVQLVEKASRSYGCVGWPGWGAYIWTTWRHEVRGGIV